MDWVTFPEVHLIVQSPLWGIKAESARCSRAWVLKFSIPEFESYPCYFIIAVCSGASHITSLTLTCLHL